jgi:hypothetical protein
MENEITKTNSFAFKPSITRSIFCSVLRKFEDKKSESVLRFFPARQVPEIILN